MTRIYKVFTDGACRGNPGPGGWGAVIYGPGDGDAQYLRGAEAHTTNNRMELQAVISAFESLPDSASVELTTDSKYVQQGMRDWIHNWKRRGWKTADKKPVKNADLWQTLDALAASFSVEWHWVKGHAGHPENEMADELANMAIDEMLG